MNTKACKKCIWCRRINEKTYLCLFGECIQSIKETDYGEGMGEKVLFIDNMEEQKERDIKKR